MTRTNVLLVGAVLVLATFVPASAFVFQMNSTQLQSLYEIDENPIADPGTDLFSVTPVDNGAEFWGSLNIGGSGWSQIQIGANYFGHPYAGHEGDGASLSDLGLGNLEGYSMFSQSFQNVSKHAWHFSLFAGIGYAHERETYYYLQNEWAMIDAGMGAKLSLDFSNAEIWSWNPVTGETSHIGWNNALNLGLDWGHVSSIGFNIAGDIPVDGEGHNFRVLATPAPEPTTLVFVGLGLLGLAFLRKKFGGSSKIN
ncbi:MAG TPA: PEP-CTERM sorting domain-containing protein [candidate division Zixibacteria bacterium]|nr:PEP-CTERM sorting domain-containing protein [candidate division Zixibacteria bacterium]